MLMPVCGASAMRLSSVRINRIQPATLGDNRGAGTVLRDERVVFVQSFCQSYSGKAEGTLKLPAKTSLQKFLSDAFDEEEAAFRQASACGVAEANAPHRFYSASITNATGEKLSGYLSIDVLDGGRESYLRQLAVLPEYQNAGIGRALVQCSMDELPELRKVTVSYRKTNTGAEAFYRKLGFVGADECHARLSRELYNGMVWYK